jgi:lysophospholipase L1-like esterase
MSRKPSDNFKYTAKKHNIFIFYLAVAVCSFFVIFAIFEFIARIYSWKMGKGFWSRPNSFTSVFFVTYDWPPPLIESTKGTFRTGKVVDLDKPENELRVICLGGSTTVNARNEEGLTYSHEIQKLLKNKISDHDIVVLNAGGDAFSTAHSLVNFSLRLLDFHPDIITIYQNINDLDVLHYGDYIQPDYSNKYKDDFYLAYEHRGGIAGTVFRLSRLLQMLKWKIDIIQETFEKDSKVRRVSNYHRGREIYRRNLESIVAVAKHHGVEVVLITQAKGEGENGDFAIYNNELRECAHKNNISVVDASKEMSGLRHLFIDGIHFTSEGVETLATLITPVIETKLLEIVNENSTNR